MKRIGYLSVLAVAGALFAGCGGGGGEGGVSTPPVSQPPVRKAAILHVGFPQTGAKSSARSPMDTPSPAPTPILSTMPSYSLGVVPDSYIVPNGAPSWVSQSKGVLAYLTDNTGAPLSAADMPNPIPSVTWTESGSTTLQATQVPLSQTPSSGFQAGLSPAWNTGTASTPGQTVFTASAIGQTAQSIYNVYAGFAMTRVGDTQTSFPTCITFDSSGASHNGGNGPCDMSNDGTNLLVPGGATLIAAADVPVQFTSITSASIVNPQTSIPLSQVYGKIMVFWTSDHRLAKWYPNVTIGTALYGGYRICGTSCDY